MTGDRCPCNSHPDTRYGVISLCLLCWGTGIRLDTRSNEPIDQAIAKAVARRDKETR